MIIMAETKAEKLRAAMAKLQAELAAAEKAEADERRNAAKLELASKLQERDKIFATFQAALDSTEEDAEARVRESWTQVTGYIGQLSSIVCSNWVTTVPKPARSGNGGQRRSSSDGPTVREIIAAHLAAHADESFTVAQLGKLDELEGRSSGLIGSTATRMLDAGKIKLVSAEGETKRYQHAG